MMTRDDIESMVTALPGVYLDYPFGEGVAVYRVPSGISKNREAEGVETDDATIPKSKIQNLLTGCLP